MISLSEERAGEVWELYVCMNCPFPKWSLAKIYISLLLFHFMYSHCVEDGESEILRNVGSTAYVYRASSLSRGSRFKIFVSI